MGYQLTSLGSLPIMSSVHMYIFVINGNWKGGRYETLERNFNEIAKQIGPEAVIAKSFDQSTWSQEICEKYLGKDYNSLIGCLPALLLTDQHPSNLNEGSCRLLIPLERAEKEYGTLESFFRALTHFILNGDKAFLQRFENGINWAEEGNRIIELKPNIYGIGINVNNLIKRIRSKKA